MAQRTRRNELDSKQRELLLSRYEETKDAYIRFVSSSNKFIRMYAQTPSGSPALTEANDEFARSQAEISLLGTDPTIAASLRAFDDTMTLLSELETPKFKDALKTQNESMSGFVDRARQHLIDVINTIYG